MHENEQLVGVGDPTFRQQQRALERRRPGIVRGVRDEQDAIREPQAALRPFGVGRIGFVDQEAVSRLQPLEPCQEPLARGGFLRYLRDARLRHERIHALGR